MTEQHIEQHKVCRFPDCSCEQYDGNHCEPDQMARIEPRPQLGLVERLRNGGQTDLADMAEGLLDACRVAELVLAEKLRRLGADPEASPTYWGIRAAIARATGERK